MQNTANFKMNKPDYNNVADIGEINSNFDVIDSGITPFYVATLNSTNTYKITTGLSLIDLQDGFSIRIAIPSESTGATKLIVDSISAIAIKKVNGNDVSNLKANGVYSLTYYNSAFILASGGVDSDKVTTSEADVLSGKIYIGSDEEIHTGAMTNNGSPTTNLNCGGTYNISSGYYSGGKVTANSLSSQTGATATAAQIIAGYTAWVNGKKLTGNATIESLGGKKFAQGSVSEVINNTQIYDININLGFKPSVLIIKNENTLGPFLSVSRIHSVLETTVGTTNRDIEVTVSITDTGIRIYFKQGGSVFSGNLNFNYLAYS